MRVSHVMNEDLDVLLADFEQWQKVTTDLQTDNEKLRANLKSLQQKYQISEESNEELHKNNMQFFSVIENLQSILSKRCDLETENKDLKEKLQSLNENAQRLEEQHKQQMTEAMNNLHLVQQAHKTELAQVQEEVHQQMSKEIDLLNITLQEKNAEIKKLQKQLSDIERDRHTEMVKLRLEYDAKLLKIQKQTTKVQNSSSSISNDIFRRKLQAAKEESEQEISSLRNRISELEKQASNNKRHR